MNTEKVFTGFTKEGKEILVYRKDSETYIDLNSDNNDVIPKENIETLKYLSETLKVLKYMPEKLVKRLYNYDRGKIIQTDRFLLGKKGTITNLKETKTKSGWYFYNVPMYDYHYNWNLNNEEYGIYVFIKKIVIGSHYEFNLYKNLYDDKLYIGFEYDTKNISRLPQFNNGMEYVNFYNYTLKDIINEPIIEKKKVYELAYEAKKEVIEKNK